MSIFNLFTFIIGTHILLLLLKNTRQYYSIYNILGIVFYIFQFVPLIVSFFWGEGYHFYAANNIERSLNDTTTCIIYNIFVIIILFYFFYRGREKDKDLYYNINKLKNLTVSKIVKYILIIAMLSPILAVYFAPNPSIYFKWAYFYTNTASFSEEFYNTEVMHVFLYISFFSFVLYYLDNNKKEWFAYFIIILITWLSSKRTFLVFGFSVIIIIDLFKGKFINKTARLINKAILLVAICVSYFIYYSVNTGKGSDEPFYVTYTMYYSRDYSIKASVFDQLNGARMLEYPGQSVLFDFFFFIPRDSWNNKPMMFSKYFTTYCQDRGLDSISTTNYYVNIWSEYISNFGIIIGPILAILLISFILKISSNSKATMIYFLGVSFVVFYFFWGVQPFTMVIYGCWAILIIKHFLFRNLSVKHKHI